MELIQTRRDTVRRIAEEKFKIFEEAIRVGDPAVIKDSFDAFVDKETRLNALNDEIINRILGGTSTMTSEQQEQEYSAIELDQDKLISAKSQYERFLMGKEVRESVGGDEGCRAERSVRLPKIQIKKFDGEVKNWLPFWSQFVKIHEDQSITPTDKFAYLRDSMVPDSPAAQLVEGYVMSDDSYPKLIQQLKSRFARDGLLIETYMRELLTLVLDNRMGPKLDLQILVDRLETQIRALESLGLHSHKYAAMLKPLVESALPEEVLRAWERAKVHIHIDCNSPDREGEELAEFMRFLHAEVEGEQRVRMARSTFGNLEVSGPHTASSLLSASNQKKGNDRNYQGSTSTGSSQGKRKESCVWCDRLNHPSSECCKARTWSVSERFDWLKKKRACFICLKPGAHTASSCKAFVKCMICRGKHFTIVCGKFLDTDKSKDSKGNPTTAQTVTTSDRELQEDETAVMLSHQVGTTLLQTLQVKILGHNSEKLVRVLLDSGSQRSYIRKAVAVELKLDGTDSENLSHSLFGGAETRVSTHRKYKITLQGLGLEQQFTFSALDQEKICNHVPRLVDPQLIQRLQRANIVLSDTGPKPPQVDILLGADVMGSLLTGLTMNLDKNLVATETVLGWTIMGPIREFKGNTVVGLANVTSELQDFWQLEVLGISDDKENDKMAIRKKEAATLLKVHVNEEGRYEVALPWKRETPRLVCNRLEAERRLKSTTRKLLISGKLDDYTKVFLEWLEMGIIEVVPEEEDIHEGFYLPHRAVLKESSATTKIRPVFDASAKDYNGLSLNLGLDKGPNLIEDKLKLLHRFRMGAIGVTADIAKAFLQISIVPVDRKYLKFLWWKDRERRELMVYRHKRVVFGVTSSPFLLNAVIEFHLNSAPEEYKEVAGKLEGTFYMDNVVTSLDSVSELLEFKNQARALMQLGQFDLRQWASGPVTLDPVQGSGEPLSILGVHWDSVGDVLFVNRNPTENVDVFTRRTLLSMVNAYYDPIGLISPYTVLPRRILQDAWATQGDWDDELSSDLQSKVKAWMKDANLIPTCKLQRRLTKELWPKAKVSLHIFCDASQYAYAACVFLREEVGQTVQLRLVLAKTRIAPKKPALTVPRLELMAALIGVRLSVGVVHALEATSIPRFYWSDSTVALNWIKGSRDWSVFVRNRCAEILRGSTIDQWFHVPGALNPADLLSRGCSAKILVDTEWWEGPGWLKKGMDQWPVKTIEVGRNDEEEINKELLVRTVVKTVQVQTVDVPGVPILSHFIRIKTTVARMLRWRIHHRGHRNDDFSSEELQTAENRIFRAVQVANFGGGSKFTKEHETFWDQTGLLRLKTRLTYSDESEGFKNPILLPGRNKIIQAFIREQHFALNHAHVRTMMTILRERFWITDCRRTIKRIIRGCKQCKRHSEKPIETPFSPLPRDRIRLSAVFEVTGVDYAGPLYLVNGEKAWVVLFTCAVYRAIHLETVTSLSTDAFFDAVRRFIARRGRPSVIYSDNGTQMKGANNALKSIDWNAIVVKSSITAIQWKFSPPAAPWWGGFWERLVGMVKQLLRRNLGRATLSYQELNTLLCEIEGTINARPLTHDDELQPLTPAMFIQGMPATGVEDLDELSRKSLNSRLKHLLKLRESLRARFRREYQALLVNRGVRRPLLLQPGDVVLVGSESVKRQDWPLARILKVMGRIASLKLAGGRELCRPVHALIPLEVKAQEDLFAAEEGSTQDKRLEVKAQEDLLAAKGESTEDERPEQARDENLKQFKTRSGRPVQRPDRLQL